MCEFIAVIELVLVGGWRGLIGLIGRIGPIRPMGRGGGGLAAAGTGARFVVAVRETTAAESAYAGFKTADVSTAQSEN